MPKKTIKEVLETPIVSAIKEAGRVVIISVIPIVITSLQADKFDWKLIWVTAGIALLRFVDKLIHEQSKVDAEQTLKGLVPF